MKGTGARQTIATALLLVAACGAPDYEAQTVPHGSLSRQGEVWVMRLDGTPEERGRAAGQLVGAQIRWALPKYLLATLRTTEPRGYVEKMVLSLADAIPEEPRVQIRAMAEAAGISESSLLVANLAPEIFAGLNACSCLGARGDKSADGVLRLARNLDWHGGEVLKDLGLVVVETGRGHRFASFTWPGLVGVVSGMNDAGLSIANLVVLNDKAHPQPGLPVMFAVREMLERHADVGSAVDWYAPIDRTIAQNYALADTSTVVVLEASRSRFVRRSGDAGFVAIANAFDEAKSPGPRFRRMAAAGQAGALDVAKLEATLAEVAIEDLNVQALIFEPATRRVYGSTQSRPAAKGPYWTLDLAPIFGAR